MIARGGEARIIAPVVVLASVMVLLALPAAPVLAARGHVFGGQFGEKGSGNGQFNGPEGIAVNEATGRVYVTDSANNRVEYFSATGKYEGQFNGSGMLSGEGKAAGSGPGETPTGEFLGPESIAVDNSTSSSDPSKGDVYVVDSHHNVIDKFTASGEYIGQLTGTPGVPFHVEFFESGAGQVSLTVDPFGRLLVVFPSELVHVAAKQVAFFDDEIANGFIEELEAPLGFLRRGLAVDSKDDLYIEDQSAFEGQHNQVVEEVNRSGKQLNREVGGEEVGAGEAREPTIDGWPGVEVSSGDVYLGQANRVSRYTPEGVLVERLGEGRLAAAAGIAVNSTSGVVYVADSAANTVEEYRLEPPGKATIGEESVSEVTSGSATFFGELNPRGAATEYRFEYGKCPEVAACPGSGYEASVPAPDGVLGASFEVANLSAHLQALQSHTVYHFRLVAYNGEFGEVVGGERVFTTQPGGGPLVLPDGRAWELVTPPSAHGAQFFPINEAGLEQAAAGGTGFAYLASYPTEPDPQGYGVRVQALASRGQSGWSSVDVAMSHSKPVGAFSGFGQEYRFFSEDLSSAVAESVGPFSRPENEGVSEAFPEPTERTPYVRHDTTCPQAPATCYEPVLTGIPGEEDVLPGKKFGGSATEALGAAVFVGATPDVSHVSTFGL